MDYENTIEPGIEPVAGDSERGRGLPGMARSLCRWMLSEASESLNTTASIERLWFIGRITVILVSVIVAYAQWGDAGSALFIYGAGAIAFASNLALLVMLRRGKVAAVAVTGLAMDNVALLLGWTGSLWLLGDELRTNDLYLAMFPILAMWTSRLGFGLGIPYTMFWIGWISWTYIAFLPANSYEIEQLPTRIVFLGLGSMMGMWIARILRSQKRLVDASNIRASYLQQLDAAKDQFISAVSHELRTPLASILGFARLVRSDTTTEVQRDRLDVIERNGERLKNLIEDLLDLSKIQNNSYGVDIMLFEVKEFLITTVDDLSSVVEKRKQKLDIDIAHADCWIQGDRVRLAQVLTNLVANASKYSPADSTIRVTSRVEDGELLLSVADEGAGIDWADQESLFRPFFRTKDSEGSAIPGTGLGLFIARSIVKLHDGQIDLTSEPGSGTTIDVRLPDVSFDRPSESDRKPAFANRFADLDEAG